MKAINILWIDDEIDLLKVHILLLEERGYKVCSANNAQDGYEMIKDNNFDIIFLDENMPGISGLEILPKIKREYPNIPVIMVTKREEEEVMDEAIGNKINGYLIKPVNPNQVLLAIKQNVLNKRIIGEKTAEKYQTDFRQLSTDIAYAETIDDWINIYNNIVYWDIELDNAENKQMLEILSEQKKEANNYFCKFVTKNYVDWISDKTERPAMLFDMLEQRILPLITNNEKVFLIVIDNLRFDQWKVLRKSFTKFAKIDSEDIILSILPTATQYARNAFFAGMLPFKIAEKYPDMWSDEEDEGNKNDFEFQLVKKFFASHNKNDIKISYQKILNEDYANKKLRNINSFLNNHLNIFVFNFVDMLSHAKTSVKMIKDLAKDEKTYRELIKVWFKDSYLEFLLSELEGKDVKIIVTTDHGTVLVKNPVQVIGDRHSSTNIRYKQGKNLNFKSKSIFEIKNPIEAGLPKSNITSTYVFAQNSDFLVYPKNYHYYANYYKNTFQHGGISLEELLIPFIILKT